MNEDNPVRWTWWMAEQLCSQRWWGCSGGAPCGYSSFSRGEGLKESIFAVWPRTHTPACTVTNRCGPRYRLQVRRRYGSGISKGEGNYRLSWPISHALCANHLPSGRPWSMGVAFESSFPLHLLKSIGNLVFFKYNNFTATFQSNFPAWSIRDTHEHLLCK